MWAIKFRSYSKLILVLVLMLSISCEKKADKWKIPTSVKFKMDINHSSCLAGDLSFTGGNIMLASFTFDGKRDQGGDVYFNKTYNPLNVVFDPNNTVSEWSFDIPQGTYPQIKISFKTSGNSGSEHIIINGTYKNTASNTINPVRFEFEAEEAYEIIAKTSSGSTQIVLDKNTPTVVGIIMDPAYWFQVVTTAMMDNASLANINGNQTILINEATNTNIYEAVKDRVHDDVTRVTF